MDYFSTTLYQKQAERITALLQQIKDMEWQNKQLKQEVLDEKMRKNTAADFYMSLIKVCGDDVMLQDEWRRFISVLRIAHPNLPGITVAEKEFD